MRLRLALVDDHRLFREGLRAVLAREPDLEVAGEAEDARGAYELVEQAQPDVVLMDVGLRGMNGIAATRELARRRAPGRVLMLTMHAGEDFVAQAFTAGAAGYALKSQSSPEIVEAVRVVARGRAYLCPQISRLAVEDFLRGRRDEEHDPGPCDTLSPREREIFDLLVRGHSNAMVAKELCISVKTVETHRAHILKKLHVHSMVELLRFAARHDLIAE